MLLLTVLLLCCCCGGSIRMQREDLDFGAYSVSLEVVLSFVSLCCSSVSA